MAWAVPFAGNLVRDFQYEHFRYWNVPPRWDKIAYEHGTFVLVPKMSHRKKKVEKRQIWLFSYFCSGDPTLDVSVIAWLVTGMSHQSDTRVVTTWLVNKMSHRKKKIIWWTLWEELLLKNEQNYQYFWSKNWCLWRNFCILKAWETSERSKILPRNQYLVKWICTKSKKIAKETKFFAKKRGFSPGLG